MAEPEPESDNTSEQVRLTLPNNADVVDKRLDGCVVSVEYDSNYSDGTVTVEGVAEYDPADVWDDSMTTLNVADRQMTNNHVFNKNNRHVGKDPVVTVTMDRNEAIDLITSGMDYDVDDTGEGKIYVQAWDSYVIEEQGFMAGTIDVEMQRV